MNYPRSLEYFYAKSFIGIFSSSSRCGKISVTRHLNYQWLIINMKVGGNVRHLSKGAYNFGKLDQHGKIIAEYIWIGGSGLDIRSKARVLSIPPVTALDQIPEWNFDGSSTNQAKGHDSEIWIWPVAYYPDPFRGENNILVLCDTYRADNTPANSNFRISAKSLFDETKAEEPWFGMEQEYTLVRTNTYPNWPLGFPEGGYPEPQGPYYCSNGATYAFGRQVMEAHMRCCLHCGLEISGTNAEVMPGQWEFQIGPVTGITAGDQMWIARYLLLRVAEHFGVGVTFECKPMKEWNGAGMHTNYSTNSTRAQGGLDVIETYAQRLKTKNKEFCAVSGRGNEQRMIGKFETATLEEFTWGVADRGASCRIPRVTERDGRGYMEDRRPASNCDPYVITSLIADITINEGANMGPLHARYLEFLSTCGN